MDPADEAPPEPLHEETPPRPAPVMDVVPPPAALPDPDPDPDTAATPETKPGAPGPKSADPPKLATPPKPGNGVTAAIIATVIIVLGLASLAVFAYLQSPK